MRTEGPAAVAVATYIEALDEEALRCQRRGLSGDWSGLHRRLDALARRVSDDAERAAVTDPPDWAHRLEYDVLIDVLLEALLPPVVEDIVAALRRQGSRQDGDPAVWAPLDRRSFEQQTRGNRKRELLAEVNVLAPLERYARKPSHLRLLEAVRSLADLHEARMLANPAFDTRVLIAEGERLIEAVRTVLPPTARSVLGAYVEEAFRSELKDREIELVEPLRSLWHHKIPGLGPWHPVWPELRLDMDEPDPPGTWFVQDLQAAYELWHARAKAERAKRRRREQRGRRAAAAEAERRKQMEVQHKAGETRAEQELDLRNAEDERNLQKAREEAQQRARRRDKEQERQRRADQVRQLEEDRTKGKEQHRRSREMRPPQPLYWKRRSEETQRRWGESEWLKWCRKKGMSPTEFSDRFREAFIRQV